MLRARSIITSRLGHRISGSDLNAPHSQNPRHIDGYASDFAPSDRSNLTPTCAPKREVIIERALRKVIPLFLVFLSFFICHCAEKSIVRDTNISITILHTNDIHGHAWPNQGKDDTFRGGFAAQAALVEKIRKEVNEKGGMLLVLSAGDVNTGMPESDLLKAEPDFQAMNRIGYDAMTLGNHDLDHGYERVLVQKGWAKFPVLSANVLIKEGNQPMGEPFVIFHRPGIRIGIVGLTTGDLPLIILGTHAKKLMVKDPIETAKTLVPKMKAERADLIIALTHLGLREVGGIRLTDAGVDDRELAAAVPEIQVVIGGHSHTLLPDGLRVGNQIIVQAGEHGQYLGRLDLTWDPARQKIINWRAQVLPVLPGQGEDTEVKNMLAHYETIVGKFLDEQIGVAEVELNGNRQAVRHGETNLGNLLTDAIRIETKSDVAVMNGGGIRSSIAKGPIRLRDIYKVFPFKNTASIAHLTGEQLKTALETGLTYQNATGSFLQVSGIRFIAQGSQVMKMTRNGKPLRPTDKIKLATSNFLMLGGDHFGIFKTANAGADTFVPLEDYLIRYIKKKKHIRATVEGRIQLRPALNNRWSPDNFAQNQPVGTSN